MKPSRKQVHLTEFFLGYGGSKPWSWRENTRSHDARRLASPLNAHLVEVNRFLFGGGVAVDVVDADPEDPRQILLDKVNESTGFLNCLDQLWERGATTGSVLITYYPDPDGYYKFKLYDALEYELTEDGDGYKIEYPGEDDYWVRMAVTPRAYEKYKKVRENTQPWTLEETIPHNYPKAPAIVIHNKKEIGHSKPYGIPEFDSLALDLCLEILLQTLDAASNYRYFGNPLLVSPYPQEILEALKNRVQVLQGSQDQGMSNTEAINLQAVPSSHPEFVETLTRNLHNHLGSAWVDPKSPPQISSIALKTIHAASISTAEKRWNSYVNEGLEKLYGEILLAATYDGLYTAATPNDPQSYSVNISRLKPYFTPTPQDKVAELSVTQTLIGLGVDPLVALQEFYPHLTTEEIQEKMIAPT